MENGAGEHIVPERRLVIGLDYGTTFTGIAYATPLGRVCTLEEIDVMADWGSQMDNHEKVPSVISYSLPTAAMEQQWGSSLSPDAVTMVHTKLELDPNSLSDEMDLILQSLDGMKNLNFGHIKDSVGVNGLPAYTQKSSEEIVTDYLSKVFQYLERVVESFSEELRALISTDIVVTIPTGWSHRAMNSTYRALTKAGFNQRSFPMLKEIIFVTESEAAAVYTSRYLKSVLGQEFLKLNESFVLCDAGGGTVDVVSYTVKNLSPSLQLEEIGKPTGRKCGSIFINMAFKRWLRSLIEEDNYKKLDPNMEDNKISSHSVEGKAMRELMKEFDARKQNFHDNYGKDIRLDLPVPLQDLNLPGRVNQGEVTIPCALMEDFFDGCVAQIVDLIRDHLHQIERLGSGVRTKNVFLVGGFGESLYLQEQIRQHLSLEGLNLRRPNTSWTAVVQGAVICGIEKLTSQKLVRANYCRHHYGVNLQQLFNEAYHPREDLFTDPKSGLPLAQGQLIWLLNKGDLVASNNPLVVKREINLNFSKTEEKKKTIPIYRYSEDDDRPTRFFNARNELTEVCRLEIDLSNIPWKEFQLVRRKPDAYRVPVQLVMTLAGDKFSATVWRGNEELVREVNIPY